MKKAQVYRRLKTLYAALRDMFVEEEPREKARRTMREATLALNRIIYQRLALENELESGNLDEESRRWCRENLRRLDESERVMTAHLASLREQYRTLMLQDLFYKTINDPGADCVQEAQAAIMELQAAVEAERTLRAMPRLLEDRGGSRALKVAEVPDQSPRELSAADPETIMADGTQSEGKHDP